MGYIDREKQTFSTRYLSRDIERYLKSYAEGFAKASAEDMVSAAEKYIGQFYADYDPERYIRTFNFRDNSYSKVYEENGNRYTGGVRLSPSDMDVYLTYKGLGKGYTKTDPQYIWEHSLEGWHGDPKNPHWTPPRMSPTPMYLISEYYRKNCNLNNKKYKNAAKKYAEKQHYSTFGF